MAEQQREEAREEQRERLARESARQPVLAHLPAMDESVRPPHQHAYYVKSKRGRCPICTGIFVITARGTLHAYDCRPVAAYACES